jgi:3',5'-cyclic AMP phosphodiesterase CpdA
MATILHLSDLHFGAIDGRLAPRVIAAARELSPDLTVVSGDLTQRARARQYRSAAAFLETLPRPRLVVPGNHDVPLYRVWERALAPLAKYRQYIAAETEPFVEVDGVAALGLSSARSLTIQDGRLNGAQVARISAALGSSGALFRVLVTHHPIVLPPGAEKSSAVGGASDVVHAMGACRGDAVLTGHLHTGHAAVRIAGAGDTGWGVMLIQAGTALSTRLRGEQPGFNILRIGPGDGPGRSGARCAVEHRSWSEAEAGFVTTERAVFRRGERGWAEGEERGG